MKVTHSRIQHGVGQGSFHSATVEALINGSRTLFAYVYDCGARSGSGISKELTRSIKRVGMESREDSLGICVLDVIVLSHYDADHLNGAKQLSDRFGVDRVFVPYLGPEELAFIIAFQADTLSAEQVTELHQLAHGSGTLWDVPVTMVRGGGEGGSERPPKDDAPPRTDEPADRGKGSPKRVRVRLGPPGKSSEAGAMPSTISHQSDVLVELSLGKELWKLRFWNRGLDDSLTAEIKSNLEKCGFPLDKSQDPAGAVDVNGWLATPKNRKAAVKAYGDAINKIKPSWAQEARNGGLANLLSLAMYSGPDFKVGNMHCHRRYRDDSVKCCFWHHGNCLVDKAGWLGTGDAPLGELDVWEDFSNHFSNELSEISTYLLPHHGAAPDRGPLYYNAGLNSTAGIASVISYGTTNSYGHPKFSVLTEVVANHGVLVEVTEKDVNGFHEVFCLRECR